MVSEIFHDMIATHIDMIATHNDMIATQTGGIATLIAACSPCSACPTHSVYIIFNIPRKVIVHHVPTQQPVYIHTQQWQDIITGYSHNLRNVLNVKSSGGHISGY